MWIKEPQEKIRQRLKIFIWWKESLLKKTRINLIELDKQTPYFTKKEKLKFLQQKKYKKIKYSPSSLISSDENREIIKEHEVQ